MVNLADEERAHWKRMRNAGWYNTTDTTEGRYGTNFELVENQYLNIYRDYLHNLLVNLITYEGAPITLDVHYIEFVLRTFGYCRIGAFDKDNVFVLQADGRKANTNPQVGAFGFLQDALDYKVPNPRQEGHTLYQLMRGSLDEIKAQLAHSDEGCYLVLSNKYNYFYGGMGSTFVDDALIERVAKTLAKIKATAVFNMEQMKVPFVGFSTNKNLTSKNLWANINQGMPFVEVDSDVDDINRVVQVMNLQIPNFLPQLKDAWNNEMSEMLTMLGINNVGVDKKERLLANEVDANSQLIEASGNIYLDARNNQLQMLNYVLGTNIKAKFNQDAYNALVSLTREKKDLEEDFDEDVHQAEEGEQ